MNWSEFIMQLASIVTALTTLGGALFWLYKKLVLEPDKKMAETLQRESNEELRRTIEPLSKAIDLLNRNLKEANKERERLDKKTKKQDAILQDHEIRLSVVEDWKQNIQIPTEKGRDKHEGNTKQN